MRGKVEAMYLPTDAPPGLSDPMPGDIRGWALNLVKTSLSMTASPGYPLCAHYRTNADVPPEVWSIVADVAVLRVALLHHLSDAAWVFEDTPEACQFLVAVGATDPVKLFVKNEPHTAKKLVRKGYRLISSVSVVDQLVSRMLHGDLNELEIRNFHKLPSQPGMGLEDVDFKRMAGWITGEPLVSTDISGFDWNVALWMLEDEALVRCALYQLPEGHKARRAIMGRARALAHAVFVLSDGTMYAQCVPGLQKSGDYTTSSTNSRIMAMLLVHSGATKMWCMGDDAVSVGTDETRLRAFLDVKEFVESETELTFCSHSVAVYRDPVSNEVAAVVSFTGWEKAGYRLLSTCPKIPTVEGQEQQVFQFSYCMRHDPEERDDVLRRLRPHVLQETQRFVDLAMRDELRWE